MWEGFKSNSNRVLSKLALRPESPLLTGEGIEMNYYKNYPSGQRDILTQYHTRRSNWKKRIHPSDEQWTIIWILIGMMTLITIFYQFRFTRLILYPFSIISTVFHEFGHALMCLITGGRMGNIQIRMDESGVTRFHGGMPCLILPAGYIGSTLMGAVLIFVGFGYRTARYSVLGISVILLVTLYYSSGLFTLFSSIFLLAVMLGSYFFRDGLFTRHFTLFLGSICSLQAILSILNTTVFHTIEGSDAYEFARQCSFLLPAAFYGLLWLIISLALIGVSIISALIFFKK